MKSTGCYVFFFFKFFILKSCFPLAFLMITKVTLIHTFHRNREELYPRCPSKVMSHSGGCARALVLISESVLLTRGLEGPHRCEPCLRLCPWDGIGSPRATWIPKQKPAFTQPLLTLAHKQRHPGEGNGTPLQYSRLENPMDRGAWQAVVHGVAKSRT